MKLFRKSRIFSDVRYYVGRLGMLAGIFSLSVATAILALSSKLRRVPSTGDASLGLMAALVAGALSFYLSQARDKKRRDLVRESCPG